MIDLDELERLAKAATPGTWDTAYIEREAEKQNDALRWTKEAPTKSGWYFVRGDVVVAQPVHNNEKNVVYINAEEDIIVYGHRAPWRISETLKKYTVEFAGPIQEPEE